MQPYFFKTQSKFMFYLGAYFAAKRISGNKDFILNNSVALANKRKKNFFVQPLKTFPRINMQNSVHF